MVAQRLVRNLLGCAGVLAALAIVVFGLPALDRAVPSDLALADGARYEVGARVTVVPPDLARVDASKTRPGEDRGTVLFMVGSVRYVIVVTPFGGPIEDAAARLRTKIQAIRGYQVTAGEGEVATDSGIAGIAGGYTSPGKCGRYVVFLTGGLSIEVTVSGAEPELQQAIAGIDASIDSIEHRDGE
jgi:hypothetical protein